MMRIEFVLLTILLLAINCQSDKLDEVLKTSKNADLDKIFYQIYQVESSEFKNVAIVDRSINRSYFSKDSSKLENDIIYWTKEIFPKTTFISGDSILHFEKVDTDKYWNLREATSSGWIEISAPKFSKDKQSATVHVLYLSNTKFGSGTKYTFKKTDNVWVIVNKELTSIS